MKDFNYPFSICNTINLDENTANKIFRIAELMENLEFMGYLGFTSKFFNNKPIIDKYLIAETQSVTSSRVQTDGIKNAQMRSLFRKNGGKVAGWAHGHGSMNVFYSDIDVKELLKYKAINFDSCINLPEEHSHIKDAKDCFLLTRKSESKSSNFNLQFLIDKDIPRDFMEYFTNQMKIKIRKGSKSESYGITVNKFREIYGITYTSEIDKFIEGPDILQYNKKLKFIKNNARFSEIKPGFIQYMFESKVNIIPSEKKVEINDNKLIDELKTKIVNIKGNIPFSFKTKVQVPPNFYKNFGDIEVRDENQIDILLNDEKPLEDKNENNTLPALDTPVYSVPNREELLTGNYKDKRKNRERKKKKLKKNQQKRKVKPQILIKLSVKQSLNIMIMYQKSKVNFLNK